MRAIRQYEPGAPETLRYEDVPDPTPVAEQVVVAVEAAGVHVIDTSIRRGDPAQLPFPPPALPMTPGREVSGRVVRLGPGVDPSWLHRRVVAHLGMASGGYAEQSVVAVTSLHAVPDHVPAAVVVAMIGTGRTAVAVLDRAAMTPADVVLVTAAAGGLGNLFVQSALEIGAAVVGPAGGPAKVTQVVRLGAQIAVDSRAPDWPDQVRAALDGRSVSLVLDGVGGPDGRAAFDLLGSGGRHLIYGWSAGTPTAIASADIVGRGLSVMSLLGPSMINRPGGMRELETEALARAAEGRWTPLVHEFPLADAAGAHRAIESRATIGKVVLVP